MGRARRAGGGVEGSRRAVERRGDDDAAVHGDADDAAFPLRGGVLGGCSPASHARNAAVREHRPAAHRRSARTASRKAARQSTRDAATRGGATASASARPNRAAKSARQRCGEEAGARHDAHADAALAAERNPAARHTRSTHSNGRSSHGAPRASTTTREGVAGGDPSGLGPVGSAKGAGRRARAARGRAGPPGGRRAGTTTRAGAGSGAATTAPRTTAPRTTAPRTTAPKPRRRRPSSSGPRQHVRATVRAHRRAFARPPPAHPPGRASPREGA